MATGTRKAKRSGLDGAAAVQSTPEQLMQRIQTKRAKVGVIGLGYVGLPLVRLFWSKGFPVVGFDIDDAKVKKLNAGRSYILSVPEETTRQMRQSKRFEATADFSRLQEADALIICVPTPLTADGRPDLSYIQKTAQTIARYLRTGQLISLESTTYPGTTREVLVPELEKNPQGLKVGVDYFVAFSPEREDPGNKHYSQETIPKVVGGFDPESGKLAAALYRGAVNQVVEVSRCEVAEACKILENVYRCVNIALVNELKMLFDRMGIDVFEVIRAASTKPFGFQPFYPGPGWGGHCIPIDPFYLSWKAREYQFNTRFIELAGEINTQMPYYVVGRLEEALRRRGRPLRGAKVLLLGVAYKKDIDDPRESPAFRIMELLMDKGGKLSYNDPYIPTLPKMRHFNVPRLKSVELTRETLAGHDAVLIVTDHSSYDWNYIVRHARLVVDTRNATANVLGRDEKVVRC